MRSITPSLSRGFLFTALCSWAAAFETPLGDLRISGANFVQSGATFTVSSGGTLVIASGATFSLPADTVTWASLSKSGSSLADLTTRSAADLSSGTLPDARFPATLPAASGANLTALNATQLTTGTIPDARFPATLPAASGANLTALNATQLTSGTVPVARLPLATASVVGAVKPDGTTITVDAAGVLTSIATGNVTGAASSTDFRLVLMDGTTGKAVKQSSALTESGGTFTSNTEIGLQAGGTNQLVRLKPSGTGSVVVTVAPGSATAGSGLAIDSTDGYPFVLFQLGTVTKAMLGVVRTSGIIGGSTTDDFGIRAVGNILFSTDNGTSYGPKIVATTGQLAQTKTTASTSTTTGSIVNAGGLGNAGAIYSGSLYAKTGTSTLYSRAGGSRLADVTLTTQTTTAEGTLATYTLTDTQLVNAGDSMGAEYHIRCAANTNAKQLRLKLGATTVWDSGSLALNDTSAVITARVVRPVTATDTQLRVAVTVIGGDATLGTHALVTVVTVALSTSPTLVLTGQGAATDDIHCHFAEVTYHPAP